jgi:alpha-ketoglutaric semialdehyde dehydrogenase
MTLFGTSIIGATRGVAGGEISHGLNASTGENLDPVFHGASAAEVDTAANLAAEAFPIYSKLSGKERAKFLRAIASEIEALGDTLTQRAMAETGLPEARIKGETGRTTGQLRMHASVLEEGSWCDARIDHADPQRQPIPKVDIRSMQRAIGPVAVFCASNFPLAFSVAGGDSCAAWAAGCPVIVKAHSSHPGTAELVGHAVRQAVVSCGLPDGVFSLLYGSGREVGATLVKHPEIKAVGFTGSRAGGRALMDLAAARPCPIPVYAEMSSINPTIMLAGALAERAPQLAAGLHGSVTASVGQMCTNPGLIILDVSGPVDAFQKELGKLVASTTPGTMLNPAICKAYRHGAAKLRTNSQVQPVAFVTEGDANTGSANVFATSTEAFLTDPTLSEEVFGPTTLLVHARGKADILRILHHLEGQLTATLHGTDEELAQSGDLLAAMESKAGRVIINGFPTGVEVCQAIVHGGPYPATSDGRSTSVGVQAVSRFTRPVAFQNFPDAALPAELQEANPLAISRIVDGVRK